MCDCLMLMIDARIFSSCQHVIATFQSAETASETAYFPELLWTSKNIVMEAHTRCNQVQSYSLHYARA